MAKDETDITPAILMQHMQGMETRLTNGLRQEMQGMENRLREDLAGKTDLNSMEARITKRLDSMEKYADSILTIVENIHKKVGEFEKRVTHIEQRELPAIKQASHLA